MTIEQLVERARRLGLLETIHVGGHQQALGGQPAGSSAATNGSGESDQHMLYAIVIDFEATCWPQKSLRQPEIIEFPAILVDLRSGRTLAEFHHFVRPTEAPQLSDFCTQLTGITQQLVDAADALPAVLAAFAAWLRRLPELTRSVRPPLCLPKTKATQRAGNACFATWSDWDLGVCLRAECERKRLDAVRPAALDQWMDLRAVYRAWYATGAQGFADALRRIGMRFEGREHSGLADARNEARLAARMWRDGAPLRVTKDLKPFMAFNRAL